ncbi:MAG: SAM-dependent methyltransferase [Nitriliruptorales bacterium]|nr:SAM-dependent methyltransferase [Nitriliruptorales bacterium]
MSETPAWMKPAPDRAVPPPEIDTSVAHPARVWDFWLGGKDHYPADREVGEQILKALPDFAVIARADREFLGRAVRYLAGEAGIRQFLDIGTGIPTANNTHEVAQVVAPESRVVYVDNDPVVLAHARALLTSSPQGVTRYIDADLREPGSIIEAAAQTLDLEQPVAITLLGIMEFIPSTGEARGIVNRLMDAVPSGSYLAITHPVPGQAMNKAARLWNESGATPVTIRGEEESTSLFDGLEVLDPGIVQLPHWRPDPDTQYADRDFPYFGAVGRKP